MFDDEGKGDGSFVFCNMRERRRLSVMCCFGKRLA